MASSVNACNMWAVLYAALNSNMHSSNILVVITILEPKITQNTFFRSKASTSETKLGPSVDS